MKPIRTQQRFRCDFCKRTGIKRAMLIHEKRCYRNPNRYCDYCDNKGYTEEYLEETGNHKVDCPYCAKFNKKKLQEIEEREKNEKETGEHSKGNENNK